MGRDYAVRACAVSVVATILIAGCVNRPAVPVSANDWAAVRVETAGVSARVDKLAASVEETRSVVSSITSGGDTRNSGNVRQGIGDLALIGVLVVVVASDAVQYWLLVRKANGHGRARLDH